MFAQIAVGCVITFLGMMIALGLVRLAANLVIMLIALSACGLVVYSIFNGLWTGWLDIVWRSAATGFGSALLSIPVLPFSGFYKKR